MRVINIFFALSPREVIFHKISVDMTFALIDSVYVMKLIYKNKFEQAKLSMTGHLFYNGKLVIAFIMPLSHSRLDLAL